MYKKSQENLDAADLLIKSKKYSASIHCSYYAVFQYAKYALKQNMVNPISYSKQQKKGNKNSHMFIISLLENLNEKASNKTKSADIREKMCRLKKKREKADYSLSLANKKSSTDIYNDAKNIICEIKKTLQLP